MKEQINSVPKGAVWPMINGTVQRDPISLKGIRKKE